MNIGGTFTCIKFMYFKLIILTFLKLKLHRAIKVNIVIENVHQRMN